MTVVQHTCDGFLRFILPEDTVIVDMEVMTLKGIHIFKQDKHSYEKCLFPGVNIINPFFILEETRGDSGHAFQRILGISSGLKFRGKF